MTGERSREPANLLINQMPGEQGAAGGSGLHTEGIKDAQVMNENRLEITKPTQILPSHQ